MWLKNGVSEEFRPIEKPSKLREKIFLEEMCQREIEKTGITSLKIDFNNVFGYYIEVWTLIRTKSLEEWIRKQTLVNAERYLTNELKEYEKPNFRCRREKISQLETQIYKEVLSYVLIYIDSIQENSKKLSQK